MIKYKYDLVGQRFTRLVVLERVKGSKWLCQCDCGVKKIIPGIHLLKAKDGTKSCGCLKASKLQGPIMTCRVCHQQKPREEFYVKHKKNGDTRLNLCILCARPAMNEYKQQRDRRIRLEVLMHYGGDKPKCACCGIGFIEFLAFDHINGGGNKHKKEINSWGRFYLWLRKNNYPSGFRVLCHSCNASLGVYGYCPHEISKLHPDKQPLDIWKLMQERNPSWKVDLIPIPDQQWTQSELFETSLVEESEA